MKICLYSNEIEAHLSRFIGDYVGNICLAIVASLKTTAPVQTLRYEVSEESVRIELNRQPLPLNISSGFSEKIILSTIRGMLRHLKMADPGGDIRIEIDVAASENAKIKACD